MKTLTFQGESDDTFDCSGPSISASHDNCASGDPIWMRVATRDQSMLVCGQYQLKGNGGGCWLIGVAPDDPEDEGIRIPPDWKIRFAPGTGTNTYSAFLLIDVPDDVSVFVLDERGDVRTGRDDDDSKF